MNQLPFTPETAPELSRRNLLGVIGGAALVAAVGLELPSAAQSRRLRLSANDIDILNFALNLEYLEAEFYLYATTGNGLPQELTTGVGTLGPTTGFPAIPFTDPILQATAEELTDDEVAHVIFLRQVLGRFAIAKPALNLNALLTPTNETEFLILTRAFEDVGVSAYAGAAAGIRNRTVLSAAARILATEAYHAGNARLQVVQRGLNVPALDPVDQPPTLSNFFPTDENGLAIARTAAEVCQIVDPFFPNGFNSIPRRRRRRRDDD